MALSSELGKEDRSCPPRAVVPLTVFAWQPWQGLQEIKIIRLCLEPFCLSVCLSE